MASSGGDSSPQMAEQGHLEPFPTAENLGRAMSDNPFLADTTIVCADGPEILVHSFRIGTRSEYFWKAFRSGMKEAKTKRFEFKESPADLHLNYSYDVMHCWVEYMYCKSYAEEDESDTIEDNMRFHVDLYIAADYFRITGLQDYIIERIGAMMDNWEMLKPALPEVITVVYEKPESITSGIRSLLVNILEKKFYELKEDKVFCDFLKDFGECSRDILLKALGNKSMITGGIRTSCHFCKKEFLVELVDDYTPAYCTHCGKSNYNHALRRRAM